MAYTSKRAKPGGRNTSSPNAEQDCCGTPPSKRVPERTRFDTEPCIIKLTTNHPRTSTNGWSRPWHPLLTKEKRSPAMSSRREFSASVGDRWAVREQCSCRRRQPHFASSSRHLPQELDLDRGRAIETQRELLAIPHARQDPVAALGTGLLQELVEAGPQGDARRPHRRPPGWDCLPC